MSMVITSGMQDVMLAHPEILVKGMRLWNKNFHNLPDSMVIQLLEAGAIIMQQNPPSFSAWVHTTLQTCNGDPDAMNALFGRLLTRPLLSEHLMKSPELEECAKSLF